MSVPTKVTLMITRRCNLRCLHCGSSPEQFLREDMTTNEILGVIDELARCGVFRISISGGEPLMHPDFFTIVDAIMQKPMSWQLDTNATLVTDEIGERLHQLPRQPLVSVSFDGATAATHDRIRGPGSFAAVKRGIAILTAVGLRVRPFMVLNRLNYHELPGVVEFIQSINIETLNVTPPSSCGRAGQHASEMRLSSTELREALEVSLQIADAYPGFLTGPWSQLTDFYRALQQGTWAPGQNVDGTFQNCGAGRGSVTIASDGTVVPCDLSYSCQAGNVRDQSLLDIWRHSPVFKAIRAARGTPLSEVPGCQECPRRQVCLGPCPAGGHALTGHWPAAEPSCMKKAIGDLFQSETLMSGYGKVP